MAFVFEFTAVTVQLDLNQLNMFYESFSYVIAYILKQKVDTSQQMLSHSYRLWIDGDFFCLFSIQFSDFIFAFIHFAYWQSTVLFF